MRSPFFSIDSCYGANQLVEVEIRNFGGFPLDFTSDSMNVQVNVSGTTTQTLNFTVKDNSLNGGNLLRVGDVLKVPVGSTNMTNIGTYNFEAIVELVGDTFTINDTSRMSVTVQPYTGGMLSGIDTICFGDTVSLSVSGYIGGLQ